MSCNTEIGENGPAPQHEPLPSLARQLHQTAQPLSVLQGVLELALMRSSTVEDYKRSVEIALRESARITACFEELRQLIAQRESEQQTPGVPRA